MKEYEGRGRKDDPAAGSHRETERSLREDMKYGKIAVLVAVCTALTTMMSPVAALAEYDTPYVAFGADLTEEQKSEVLDLLEVPSDKVTEDTSLYVTNEEEHRYLDGVLGSDVIGTHALSSCKVVRQEKGHGIHVETHNVTYVTDEMYANALATAGVEDADIDPFDDMTAELTLHYSGKSGPNAATKLETTLKLNQGELKLQAEGEIRTTSTWPFVPFDVSNALPLEKLSENEKTAAGIRLLKNADEAIVRKETEQEQ